MKILLFWFVYFAIGTLFTLLVFRVKPIRKIWESEFSEYRGDDLGIGTLFLHLIFPPLALGIWIVGLFLRGMSIMADRLNDGYHSREKIKLDTQREIARQNAYFKQLLIDNHIDFNP